MNHDGLLRAALRWFTVAGLVLGVSQALRLLVVLMDLGVPR